MTKLTTLWVIVHLLYEFRWMPTKQRDDHYKDDDFNSEISLKTREKKNV